jgi:hypothetical protein
MPRADAASRRAGLALVVAAVASAAGDFSGPRGSRTLSSTAGSRVRRCAGARQDCRPRWRAPRSGSQGSAALRVRTMGAADGEGRVLRDREHRPREAVHLCGVRARHRRCARICCRLSGDPVEDVQRVAPPGDTWAADNTRWLLEAACRQRRGTRFDDLCATRRRRGGRHPAQVSFLLDDAQLQRATTPGAYVETGDQTAGRPSHPTDLQRC